MCVFHSMQPNKSVQDNFFDIIAKAFVTIILPMPLEGSDKFIEVSWTDNSMFKSSTCVWLDC